MGEYKCSERTRTRIYQAAQDLFAEKGFKDTSLLDIAERANISTGTLYRYYPSKSDFLLSVANGALDELSYLAESLPENMPCVEKIYSLMEKDMIYCQDALSYTKDDDDEQYYMHLAHRSAIYSSVKNLRYAYGNRSALADIYKKIIISGIEREEIASYVDADNIADLLVAFFFRQFDLALLEPKGEGSLESLRDKLASLFRLMS
ncbi:MAG: TetR/AcrR family transcriptional regulator [Raoultibacter sp.]